MKISINGEYLDMPAGFTASVEESSPIFSDRGSQTLPVTLPATPRNMRLLGFPARVDSLADRSVDAVVEYGPVQRSGRVNVLSASTRAGIELNIGFDNSIAYDDWRNKPLREVAAGRVYADGGTDAVLAALFDVFTGADPRECPVAVFPVALDMAELDTRMYWEVVNIPADAHVAGKYTGFSQPATLSRVIDGKLTEVKVPAGYGVTPFIRVWALIDMVFDSIGLAVSGNVFHSDRELSRLVVLNNTADTCCRGRVDYADMMPNCTVEDFLHSLWVRFGLTYRVDYDRGTASLALIRDIISERPGEDITRFITAPETVTYETPKYVRLKAQSSIEGATPACDRFEDFVKGADLAALSMGPDIAGWRPAAGAAGQTVWDGDVRDDWGQWEDYDPTDPDYPDPPDPDYDDGRDDDMRSMRRAAACRSTPASSLAREFQSGNWYRLDPVNGEVKQSSTPFFDWDPQSPGLDALDLSSTDEWVPMCRPSSVTWTTALTPDFRVGARHLHTYIKDSDDSAGGDDCPLAFLIAYTFGGKTIGSYCPESPLGEPYRMDDGTFPRLSLLFQFADGLFARFWQGYDEMLRHAARTVEVDTMVSRYSLPGAEMLRPLAFRRLPCLAESIGYTVGQGAATAATYRLRMLVPYGAYDIRAEQGIPDIRHGGRRLVWALKRSDIDTVGMLDASRSAAAARWVAATGYIPHDNATGPDIHNFDRWYVDYRGAALLDIHPGALRWDTDTTLPICSGPGLRCIRRYRAQARYSISEVHYLPGGDRWVLETPPLGEVAIEVEYEVELVARWLYEK